jgi:hypothetical protein
MVLSGKRTLVLVVGPRGAASGDNMDIETLCEIIIEEKKKKKKKRAVGFRGQQEEVQHPPKQSLKALESGNVPGRNLSL